MKPIEITPELKQLCWDFAVQSSTDHYRSCRQNDADRVRQQIRDGKIGEHVVYHSIKRLGTVSTPDLNHYGVGEKSWAADLNFRDPAEKPYPIHVKTCEKATAETFGMSWCFAVNDKEIFGADRNPDAVVAFVYIRINESPFRGQVMATVPVERLHELQLFDDPKLEKLRGKKKVVYLSRLKEAGLVMPE